MKRMFLSLLLATFLIMSSPADAAPTDAPVLATYTGANGIKIISHHPDWTNQTKLESVYNELMRNTHYEEINYLSTVRILASNYRSLYSGGVLTRTWSSGKVEKLLSANNRYGITLTLAKALQRIWLTPLPMSMVISSPFTTCGNMSKSILQQIGTRVSMPSCASWLV